MARLASVIEDWPLPAADSPEVLDLLPGPSDHAIVAVDQHGARLGAAWWRVDHRAPLLRDSDGNPLPELVVAVVESARGQGVGTRLIDSLAQAARERSFSALSLNVHLRNPAAGLYTRTGFRVAGAGRGWFGVAMRRPLMEQHTVN